jgi:hypothetical protein
MKIIENKKQNPFSEVLRKNLKILGKEAGKRILSFLRNKG